ncbi:MAG TPA: prefoldin subunit beta [Nitrososphaerales archaeon]|nr:prefoldin subunit beta [Nitrososphaerales archaeon]
MSQPELPPFLREQLARYEQVQQNLQAVLVQKQQVELERDETQKALDELAKTAENETIYKYAGNLLIKVTKDAVVKELTEKKELGDTRAMVLSKQETRFRENLKDLQTKIDDAVKGRQATPAKGE